MKNVKIILILMVLSALIALPATAVQLGQQSFESTTGYTVNPAFAQGASAGDYFLQIATGTPPTGFSTGITHGVDGTSFIGGEDTNGSLPLPTNGIHTIAVDAVSVVGYTNITVTIALNAKNIANYDTKALSNGDYLDVYANMDNTSDVLVGSFTKVGASASNGKFGQDTNLDGLGDVEIVDYTGLNDFTFPVSGTGSSLVVKIVTRFESGDEEIAYDNVRVNGDAGGPAYESDAHVVGGGGGGGAIISSLVDTQPEAQVVHTFQIYDAGDGVYNTNTIINGITIGQQTPANDIAWNLAIAGAELTDGTTTWTGTVAASTITFSGSPMITLIDGGAAVNLTLKVWLLTTLPFYADHSRFEFVVGSTSFDVDPAGSRFAADTPVESGDLNNEIQIIATGIGFTTQPISPIGVNVPFLVRAGFVDANNGIDEDWPAENITLSVNTGIGNLSSVSGLTIMSVSGQSTFSNLQYDAFDTGVILQATSSSFAGPALATPFNTFYAPTITIDSYPLCWDGDNTDQAQPFAVHVSIEHWTAAYGSDIRLKMYDGVAGASDCFQYTVANGWSTSNVYANKPAITIDVNGNWNGWVAIKSNGLSNIKARARFVTNNTLQITSASMIGTALDLDAQGGIIKDDNSRATGGNIILARGPSNAILGSYIAEDNGLPLDQTYTTVDAGGWCMALCEICDEEVTFESWNPSTWPGNGSPEFHDVETICVEGGATVSIDVILPVELLSFTATSSDASITLNWATASENNSNRFDVLRNNELVYQVVAANSPTGGTYAWTDNDVTNGTLYTYSLSVVDLAGHSEEIATAEATPSFNDATVTEYALHQNFPNPFNPETAIAFDLVDGGFVTLSIYNVLGQQVASLVNGTMNAGRHVVNFSATDLPSGLYLYRIEANGFTAQKKMIVMK